MADKPKAWNEPGQKEAHPKFDYTDELKDYVDTFLPKEENSQNTGLNKKADGTITSDGRFYSYPSVEGGLNTIAYGHKLGKNPLIDVLYDFEKGLSSAQAKELLIRDVFQAYKKAYNQYKNAYGEQEWNKLTNKEKVALTDFSFNVGNIHTYGIKEAFKSRDYKKIKKAINKRGFFQKDKKGTAQFKYLKTRNESVVNKYINKKDYSLTSSLIKDWTIEDNPFGLA